MLSFLLSASCLTFLNLLVTIFPCLAKFTFKGELRQKERCEETQEVCGKLYACVKCVCESESRTSW